MNDLTIAVIADVHGNIWALDAVLEDIHSRNVDQIINLGDCVYGPLDPGATAERLNQPNIITIAGNMDTIFTNPPDSAQSSQTFQFVCRHLTPDQLAWLAGLPNTYVLNDVFCCHGTPASNETSLLENITPTGVFLADTEQIANALEGIDATVILCAHTHVPRAVWLPDGRFVINPGSVGVPAYAHDLPYPHKMEAGSPHARYAVVSTSASGCRVEHIAVPYDWNMAASVAQQNGREDYVHWLKYGRAAIAQ